MRKLVISKDDSDRRLDRFLRKILPSEPLGRIFKMVRTGRVRVNGKRAAPDTRLAQGDEVELRIADEAVGRPTGPAPRRGPALVVLYRDDDVLAIDKPPFVLVQPGEGGVDPTLDELVAAEYGRGDSLTFRPSIAHRLDRGTSGVLLVGLTAAGLRGLTEAFRRRGVTKRYLALVAGRPDRDEFEVDLPLARDPSDDSRGAKVKVSHGPQARSASTQFRVLAREPQRGFALIEARPLTGRTHQIRAHLRAAKLPIVGDPTYGDPRRNREWSKRPGIRRQFLHAWRVELRHPIHPEHGIVVESPLPDDLARTLAWAGLSFRPPAAGGR